MDICAEYLKTTSNRRDTYAFLARMYRVEIDQPLLTSMKQLSFENIIGDDGFSHGAKLLEEYLATSGFNAKTDLAVDYAKTFLGIGVANGAAAFPYESVYTSPDHLVMQESHDAVLELFRGKGIEMRKGAETIDYLVQALGNNSEPADHIALELDFMAYLVAEGYGIAQDGDEHALDASIREQKDFLAKHLFNWVPRFCADIEKYALTNFYKGIASMTKGYLEADAELLDDLTKENRGAQ